MYLFKIQPKCDKEVKPKCDEVVIKKKFGSKTMRKSKGLSAESQEMIESFREFTRQYGQELSIESARHDVVRDIFATGRLDDEVLLRHPTETMRTATTKFVSWFMVGHTIFHCCLPLFRTFRVALHRRGCVVISGAEFKWTSLFLQRFD